MHIVSPEALSDIKHSASYTSKWNRKVWQGVCKKFKKCCENVYIVICEETSKKRDIEMNKRHKNEYNTTN